MSFCLLTDTLPDAALGLPIQTGFRHWVRFQNRLVRAQKDAEFAQLATETLLDLFGPSGLKEPQRAWEALLWFYRCGKDEDAAHRETACSGPAGTALAYDYEVDGPLIVAAFQQAYGIDLIHAQLHWWQFRALFDGLPAECPLHRIMEYRVADTFDMPEQTRQFYEKMREKYALPAEIGGAPHYASLEEREAAFLARLPGGK